MTQHFDYQYQSLLRRVTEEGEPHADRTGVGTTSLFGAQLRHDMRAGFPLLTVKRVPMRWVAAELEWMLKGRSDVGWLRERGVDIWDEWATAEKCAEHGREEGDLGPTYGPMLRQYPTSRPFGPSAVASGDGARCYGWFDQVGWLIADIENTPNSRRLVVTTWHPEWQRKVTLPPCWTQLQAKCHGDDGLSLRVTFRSSDIFLGLPFDAAQHGLLLELLARRTGRQPRWLVLDFGDLHLYDTHRAQAAELLSREPRPAPRLEVGPVSDDLWEFRYELLAYDPWPKIEAEVAV